MNKHSLTETLSRGEKHRQFFDTTRPLPQLEYPEGEVLACSVAYLPAGLIEINRYARPDYRRLALCAECVAHHDRALIEPRPR